MEYRDGGVGGNVDSVHKRWCVWLLLSYMKIFILGSTGKMGCNAVTRIRALGWLFCVAP